MKITQVLKILANLPWTLRFNFHYLPLSQALKLPIVFYVRPTFQILKGKIILDINEVRPNIIRLGDSMSPIIPRKVFIWQNDGVVKFKGKCVIAHNAFISCRKGAEIEFGDEASFNFGCRIISFNKMHFGNKSRVSWECTFIDTDFHLLIDEVSNKALPMTMPITIGYGTWIGHNCIISKGSRLPKNSIVSSGSVVKGKFKKENTIIAGNIATVIDEGYIRDDV